MTQPNNPDRREALKQIFVGGTAFTVGAAFGSHEEKILAQQIAGTNVKPGDVKDVEVDALSGASRTHTNWSKYADLKKPMVKKTIKGLDFSQIMMGGNLIGGWAHSRDLMYVSELVKAYHTREKIVATFKMGEACGINTYLGHHSHIGIMNDYWENAEGSMRYIADCSSIDGASECLDKGASAVYIQGETNDRLVREGKFDEIAAFVDKFRKEKAVVGLGGHRLETIKACVEKGIEPDFWMKTIHHDRYWSRMPDKGECDNVYCREPQETKEFMATLKQPWIGFKVLAAGAIMPQDGFRFAFESGADFLCVGMYDFQVVDDVNICMEILESKIQRQRPWCFT
ncbi:MAG: hypothetical protein LBI05_02025 [Planctomycetaceae bacterium]|jgi:hypothetical protein|nr:hypothetical protein [Planctomycetaceae bacterium]